MMKLSNYVYRRIVSSALMVFATIAMFAQPGKIDSSFIAKPLFHYQPEYTFDVPVDPASWQLQRPGLNGSAKK